MGIVKFIRNKQEVDISLVCIFAIILSIFLTICPLPPNSEQRLPSKSEQLKIICKGYRLALLVVERGEAERNGEQGQPAAFRSPYY